ncbi:MAG: hypothetical protein ABH896_01465 [Candidatus Jacksonbacteria bacterium]
MLNNAWWWIIVIAIALITFLIMLNGFFLRGKWKNHTDAVLGAIWLALLILSFILFGWLIALYHFIGSFIFGALIHSIASRSAAYLLKHQGISITSVNAE